MLLSQQHLKNKQINIKPLYKSGNLYENKTY